MSSLLDRHQAWILGTLGAATIVYGYYRYTYSFWSKRGVKGPTPLPLVGTAHKNFDIEEQVRRYEKYGPVWGEYIGSHPALLVADPEIVKLILIKDFNSFVNHVAMFKFSYDFDVLTEIKDDEWRRVRQIVTPAFTTAKMKRMYKVLVTCVDDLMTALEDLKGADGILEDIDLSTHFKHYSINTTARCVFAVDVNAHKDPDNPFSKNARSFFGSTSKIIILMRFLFIAMVPRLAHWLKVSLVGGGMFNYYGKLVTEVLHQRRQAMVEGKGPHNDFIQMLLEAEQEASSSGEEIKGRKKLNDREILGQCVVFLFAGYENNAILLSIVCFYLAKHPEVQEQLYDEVMSADFDYDTILHKIPLLDAVVTEASRFFSFTLDRIAGEDYAIPKYNLTIPKGTAVLIPTYAMHRSELIWGSDAKEFNPDRFMNKPVDASKYLPFGSGPRNCIGLRFALMVVKVATVRIIERYELKPSDIYTKPHPDFSTFFKEGRPAGLTINFYPREG